MTKPGCPLSKKLSLEDSLSVKAKKIFIRFSQLLWQTNCSSLERNEVLFQCGLWKEAPQALAQYDIQRFV
jgi:hypothetical protein